MKRRRREWDFDNVMATALYTLVIGLGVVLFYLAITARPAEEKAQSHLGKGAVCAHDDGDIYRCILDGKRYECIVRGEVACSPLKP